MSYDFKVTIEGTDYINSIFPSIRVTGRENDVASAILIADNENSKFYPDKADVFDSIQIYVKKASASTYTQIFNGEIRDPVPVLADSVTVTLKCKGLGQALMDTHCNRSYGSQSDNPTLDTVKEILDDLVDNMVNKSYGSANTTGYGLTKTYIPTIDAALSIAYINSPYQTNKELLNRVLMVDTAYRDGGTAGPHFFVDFSGNLRVKTIGTQQAGAGAVPTWGKYCGGSAAAVELKEGLDFNRYTIQKPSNEYANNVVLATDLRKPPYDYWTENNSSLWGAEPAWGSPAFTVYWSDNNVEFIVGNYSLKADLNDKTGTRIGFYPATQDASWDMTKWGSSRNPPKWQFYIYRHGLVIYEVRMFTTDYQTDYYKLDVGGVVFYGDPADTWVHHSIPVGPYYATKGDTQAPRWVLGAGSPDWNDINGFAFGLEGLFSGDYLLLDDMHFSGKIVREAVDTSEVTDHKEHQKVFLSRTALDDSCVASDDAGMAGYYTYAELLRRVNIPRTMTFTIKIRPELLPGEYFKVYAAKTKTGSYKINGVDFRTLQYTHSLGTAAGFNTTVSVTDDLLNSFPVNPVDQRAILNEYLLINNAKATDMKGGEVDLLIPHMRKTY